MADPAKIIDRIRHLGANVVIDGGRLQIVNAKKLPAEAAAFIKDNARAIANFLEREGEFAERAAIIQYDGGLTRAVAEYLTKLLLSSPPEGASREDWSWFVGEAAKTIDHAPLRRAA